MRLSVLVVSLLAAVAAHAEPAAACSCARGDPREALARSDAAFVGTFLGKRDDVTYRFRVDEAVKGALPREIDVRSASSGASCGIEARVGQRLGLFLGRVGNEWRSSLCAQIDPAQLRAAARPLPAPDGRGPVALLVGGRFGSVRTIALDARGRTLAYGRGAGETVFLSVCPGSRRAVELVYGERVVLGIRDLRTFRLLRERALPLDWARSAPSALRCLTSDAAEIAVFAGNPNAIPAQARLLRVTRSAVQTLWRGTGLSAGLGARRAYVSAGQRGSRAIEVDLRTGRSRQLARVPPSTGPLVPSADGRYLAGVAYSAPLRPTAPSSRLVLVDRARVRVLTVPLPKSNESGEVVWLDGRRFAFFPEGEVDDVRVYDRSLRLQARFGGWPCSTTTVRAGKAYGLGYEGRLLSARLPAGPARELRGLPGPAARVIAAVP